MSRKSDQNARTGGATASPPTSVALPASSFLVSNWLAGLLLVAVTLLAYHRVWSAGFIWDDDAHVTRPELYPLHGLWRIWFEPGATQQYYPILHSAFWVEHRIWGDLAPGYHLANLLLHTGVAVLLFRVLRCLAVPGALLAAAAFALHPVCVETAAWISEQKNTLSAVFYFGAALAYFRFDRGRGAGWYALATGLFILALAAKSVTATLPAALLVAFWWKRGQLSWRSDVLPLVPWLAMAAGAGLMTAWMERTSVGASGAPYALNLVERLLLAGRAAWFYFGKVIAPFDLIFIYPHWKMDDRVAWQYLFPLALFVVLAALYALRRRTRGPLAAALLFTGTLFPALGFIDVFPFMYSYVADHFQYLAAGLMIAALAAGFTLAAAKMSRPGRIAAQIAAGGAVVALGALTWRQTAMYADNVTLWRATLARNPECWMAYNNVGVDLLNAGRADEAMPNLEKALELNPRNAPSYTNLGNAFLQTGRAAEAAVQYEKALALKPDSAEAHTNLGAALVQLNRIDEAVSHLHRAIALDPNFAKAHLTLGNALLQTGGLDAAVAHYQRALAIEPGNADARTNLGTVFAQQGRADEAIAEFHQALVADPKSANAHLNLGNALLQSGRADGAIANFLRALQIDPDSAPAHNSLGLVLLQSGRLDNAVGHFRRALALNPSYAKAHRNLGTALFKMGQLDEADAEFQAAEKLK